MKREPSSPTSTDAERGNSPLQRAAELRTLTTPLLVELKKHRDTQTFRRYFFYTKLIHEIEQAESPESIQTLLSLFLGYDEWQAQKIFLQVPELNVVDVPNSSSDDLKFFLLHQKIIAFDIFYNCFFAAVKKYVNDELGGYDGKLRAHNCKELLQDWNTSRDLQRLSLLMYVVISSGSTHLCDYVLRYTGFQDKSQFLWYYERVYKNNTAGYEWVVQRLYLEYPPADYKMPINDWDLFKTSVLKVIAQYIEDGKGNAKKKFLAARLHDVLSKDSVTQDELLLSVFTIVLRNEAPELSKAICAENCLQLPSTSVPNSRADFINLQLFFRYGDYDTGRYASKLIVWTHKSEEQFQPENIKPTIAKLMVCIDHYSNDPKQDADGKLRATNLKNILNAFIPHSPEVERDMIRVLYLLTLTSSKDLLGEICVRIGFTKEDIETYVMANEQYFGDIAKLKKVDAKNFLEVENGSAFYLTAMTAQGSNIAKIVPNWTVLKNALLLSARYYRTAGFGQADGRWRAQIFFEMLSRINDDVLETDHAAQYVAVLVASTLLNSSSKSLRSSVLDALSELKSPIDEVALNTLKKLYGVSKKSLKLDDAVFTQLARPIDDESYEKLFHVFVFAVDCFYASCIDQKDMFYVQQKRALARLIFERTDLTALERTYRFLYLFETIMSCPTAPEALKVEMSLCFLLKNEKTPNEFLRVCDIAQRKIFEKAFSGNPEIAEKHKDAINSFNEFSLIERSTIALPTDWLQRLNVGMRLAVKRYRALELGRADGKQRAENLEKLLNTIPENFLTHAEKENFKRLLALLFCTLTHLQYPSTQLKQKIMLRVGMGTHQIDALREEMKIADEARQLLGEKLVSKDCSLDCAISDWNNFKERFLTAANAYTPEPSNRLAEHRKATLIAKISAIDFSGPKTIRPLAVLACAVAFYLQSTGLRRAVHDLFNQSEDAGLVEEDERLTRGYKCFSAMQIIFNVTKIECEAIVSVLDTLPTVTNISTSRDTFFSTTTVATRACPISNWDKLKKDLMDIVETSGALTGLARTKAVNLGVLLNSIGDLQTPEEQTKLALVSCAFVLYAKSELTRTFFANSGYSEDLFRRLRECFHFSEKDCKLQAQQFQSADGTQPQITSAKASPHKSRRKPDGDDDDGSEMRVRTASVH